MMQDESIGYIRWSRHFLAGKWVSERDSALLNELPLDMDWNNART